MRWKRWKRDGDGGWGWGRDPMGEETGSSRLDWLDWLTEHGKTS